MQAGLLLGALREVSPWDVEKAWQDLKGRGEGWKSRAQRALANLDAKFPSERFSEWLG